MLSTSPTPPLPPNARTMPDLGMALFNLSPSQRYDLLTNLLTKTRVPRAIRSLYTRGLVVGKAVESDYMFDYLVQDLMLRVSEQGHERVKEFETLLALEIHKAYNKKQEDEKPQI